MFILKTFVKKKKMSVYFLNCKNCSCFQFLFKKNWCSIFKNCLCFRIISKKIILKKLFVFKKSSKLENLFVFSKIILKHLSHFRNFEMPQLSIIVFSIICSQFWNATLVFENVKKIMFKKCAELQNVCASSLMHFVQTY